MIKKMSTYSVSSNVISQEFSDQFMLYDSQNGLIHILNETAGSIIGLIQCGHRTVSELRVEMINQYDIPIEYPLEEDIEILLTQLVEIEVLRAE